MNEAVNKTKNKRNRVRPLTVAIWEVLYGYEAWRLSYLGRMLP